MDNSFIFGNNAEIAELFAPEQTDNIDGARNATEAAETAAYALFAAYTEQGLSAEDVQDILASRMPKISEHIKQLWEE